MQFLLLFFFRNFQFSLNNSDVLEDESKTLKDYGVVGGDLIYIVVENAGGTDSGTSAGGTPQVNERYYRAPDTVFLRL